MPSQKNEATVNDTDALEHLIRQTIEEYRSERGFFGGAKMDDRDQTNLVHRITERVSERLAEIDRVEIARLQDKVSELEEEVRLASGSGYGELRQEYEAAKALAKHLVYRLGKEDDSIVLSVDDLHEMEARVDLRVEEEDGAVTVTVQEYE